MDPIQKVIDWQLRSFNSENLQEALKEIIHPETLEDLIVEAIDLKYFKNALYDEKAKELIDLYFIGFEDKEIASIFRVSMRTIRRWKKSLSAFSDFHGTIDSRRGKKWTAM